MMIRRGGNILFQGIVVDSTIHITDFNGLPTHEFKRLLPELEESNVFTSKNVGVGMDKTKTGEFIEILAEFSYKEHHCVIDNAELTLYKMRKPKCKFGLKPTQFILGRLAEECFTVRGV